MSNPITDTPQQHRESNADLQAKTNLTQDSSQSDSTDTGSESESIPYWPTEVRVTFFPSLNETRRAWILSKLRAERVSSVLDVGCGEGTLLGCLCYPPAFFNMEETENSLQDKEGNTNLIYSSMHDGIPDLRTTRLAGLDISPRALEKCIIVTASPTASSYLHIPRWESLEMKLWLGSLDVYNPEFVDYECIVSSEVIEHLPASVLPAFAQTLLGLYRPRIVLVTTPNYAFNPRFTAPGIVDPAGFRDPTGRTARVFRHSDHKFEWTPLEFGAWCDGAAATWGYTVDVDAVGLPMEKDPWGREEQLGRASQVALFRRKDEWQGEHPVPSLPAIEQVHKLLENLVHHPHPRAGEPESHEKILGVITRYMESYYFARGYSIWDLWVENTISIACGGRLDVLLSVINASPELCLTRDEAKPARDWNVKFAGGKHCEVAEASKTRYWDRNVSQESWGYQVIAPRTDVDADEIPQRPDPSREWYSLARKSTSGDVETMSESEQTWATENPWSVAWDKVKTTDIYA